MAVAPVAVAVPAVDTKASDSDPERLDPVKSATGTAYDDRYQRLRSAVMAGEIKPSVRSIRDAGYGGTVTVQRHLQRLAAEGVVVKSGQGYALAAPMQLTGCATE